MERKCFDRCLRAGAHVKHINTISRQ